MSINNTPHGYEVALEMPNFDSSMSWQYTYSLDKFRGSRKNVYSQISFIVSFNAMFLMTFYYCFLHALLFKNTKLESKFVCLFE